MLQLNRTDTTALSLAGSLTIYEVAEARDGLLAAFGTAPESCWHLDLRALEELDSAGAQLLLAAQRHLHEAGGELQLSEPSAVTRELLELLNLGALLPGERDAR